MRTRFGDLLKGARRGFHWSEPNQCFIRMSEAVKEQGLQPNGFPYIVIEMAPPGKFPRVNTKQSLKTHRVWWEGENPLPLMPLIKGVRPKRYIAFLVDDECDRVVREITRP